MKTQLFTQTLTIKKTKINYKFQFFSIILTRENKKFKKLK